MEKHTSSKVGKTYAKLNLLNTNDLGVLQQMAAQRCICNLYTAELLLLHGIY